MSLDKACFEVEAYWTAAGSSVEGGRGGDGTIAVLDFMLSLAACARTWMELVEGPPASATVMEC